MWTQTSAMRATLSAAGPESLALDREAAERGLEGVPRPRLALVVGLGLEPSQVLAVVGPGGPLARVELSQPAGPLLVGDQGRHMVKLPPAPDRRTGRRCKAA